MELLETPDGNAWEKILLDEAQTSREILEENQPNSLERILVASNSSGSLYRYLKNVKLKSGLIVSYPRIQGIRDSEILNHWYWGYNYKIQFGGMWKSKSLSVRREKVCAVKQMIKNDVPIESIKNFIKVLEDNSQASREKVLLEKQSNNGEEFSASGCLYRYLKNKKLKSGVISTYPVVNNGLRDQNNLNHWYWGYSYEILEDGDWKGKTSSVPRHKVVKVRAMIDSRNSINTIKAFIEGS